MLGGRGNDICEATLQLPSPGVNIDLDRLFYCSNIGCECKVKTLVELWQLTHLPLVSHICVSESGQHWFRQWLVAFPQPSHSLNQCCVFDNWTIRNKFHWNLNQKKQNCPFSNMHLKITSAKWRPFCRGRWVKIEISQKKRVNSSVVAMGLVFYTVCV